MKEYVIIVVTYIKENFHFSRCNFVDETFCSTLGRESLISAYG